MKYTIELTENQKKQMDFMLDMANKHMGFNRKLEMNIPLPMEMEETPAYKKGFEDGKKQAINELPELANKENEMYNDGYDNALEDFENLFVHEHDYEQFFEDTYGSKNPDYNLYDLVAKYGAKKVLDDLKKWQEEKKKEEIKVGDEVTVTDSDALVGYTFIVMQIIEKRVVGIRDDWRLYENLNLEYLEKTGRHFDEVEQLSDKLRGEE